MYSKLEVSKLRQAFWTAFGQYMAPVPSAEGAKVNWVNYKTGIKAIQFKMDADNKQASVSIVVHHPDEDIRKNYYQRFVQLEPLFNSMVGSWHWQEQAYDDNHKPISTISISLAAVNIFDQNTWASIIAFLKENIIALDAFWYNVKDGFEMM